MSTKPAAAQSPAVELWSLRIFREVATSEIVTIAATRLGITQSAVSQAIRKLELDLDSKLVERGSRPVLLIAVGTLLEGHAEPVLRNASSLPHMLWAAAHSPAQEIRLGFVDTFASVPG